MTHYMKLDPIPFMQIRMGMKTIELRLWDEKRSMIKTGDDIIFTCTEDGRSLQASVFKMHRFHDFEALYKALPLEKCGYTAEEAVTASYTDMEAYYTKEQIKSFGVVGIEIEVIR